MNHFIKTPNIPLRKTGAVLVDYRISDRSVKVLSDMQINIVKTIPVHTLYDAVNGHPDMMIHHIGANIWVSAPEVFDYFQTMLPNMQIVCGNTHLCKNYPGDIAYNIARVGKYAFHKLQYTDKVISEYYEQLGVTLINVNQGYSKCSVCILNENAIITSDKAIAKKADIFNIDTLLISPGQIKLTGMNYGFIGGVCGLITNRILAVNGDLRLHKDYNKIADFCMAYGIRICPLHSGITEDIGSIIPLFYE